MDLFEAIKTQRAMRRLKPDPIPDDYLRKILEAAIHAPSGGNRQRWAFIMVRDREQLASLGTLYSKGFERLVESGYFGSGDPTASKIGASAKHLANHFHEVPVIIAACMHTKGRDDLFSAGASIYPAVQNILLAARALNIGSTLTTIHRFYNDDVRAVLGVPAEYEVASLIPLGYPMGNFGSGERRSLDEVVHFNRWDEPPTW